MCHCLSDRQLAGLAGRVPDKQCDRTCSARAATEQQVEEADDVNSCGGGPDDSLLAVYKFATSQVIISSSPGTFSAASIHPSASDDDSPSSSTAEPMHEVHSETEGATPASSGIPLPLAIGIGLTGVLIGGALVVIFILWRRSSSNWLSWFTQQRGSQRKGPRWARDEWGWSGCLGCWGHTKDTAGYENDHDMEGGRYPFPFNRKTSRPSFDFGGNFAYSTTSDRSTTWLGGPYTSSSSFNGRKGSVSVDMQQPSSVAFCLPPTAALSKKNAKKSLAP
ncbi:hypothetical protein HK102_011345, partial [Quaeritorhiza haematococci]